MRCVDITATKVAIYETNGPNEGPLHEPLEHLSATYYHSDFDYLEVAFRGSRAVSHASRAHSGYATNSGTVAGVTVDVQPSSWRSSPVVATHTLYTHNLGYAPFVLVRLGNEIITPGYAVQVDNDNGVRLLTVIVTTTQVLLRETVWTWSGTLAALSRTYDIIGIAKGEESAPTTLIELGAGYATLGGARIDSSRRYLRAAISGEDQFRVANGKTADAANGVVRTITPLGTARDDARFSTSSYNYDGDFVAANLNTKSLSVADSNEYAGETFTDINDGRLLIVDNGNVVVDSDRSMAKVLAEINLTNRDFTYPDPPQDANTWYQRQALVYPGATIVWARGFVTQATWRPQEWTNKVTLATLPFTGANFLIGLGRCSQTIEPDQVAGSGGVSDSMTTPGPGTWKYATLSGFRTIQKTVPEDTTILINGTMILECYYMFRRTLSFAIEGDKLVAIQQQSIGGYATNNATYGGPQRTDFSDANLGSANREVIARTHRMAARLTDESYPSYSRAFGEATGYDPNGVYDFRSRWRFSTLKFLVGHV